LSPDDDTNTERDAALAQAQSAGERLARFHVQQMTLITDGYRLIERAMGVGWPEPLNLFWGSYIGYLVGQMHGALGVEATRALLHQITEEWDRTHVN
jgi:hypothetical protein